MTWLDKYKLIHPAAKITVKEHIYENKSNREILSDNIKICVSDEFPLDEYTPYGCPPRTCENCWNTTSFGCEHCGSGLYLYNDKNYERNNYCGNCGHKLNWENCPWKD